MTLYRLAHHRDWRKHAGTRPPHTQTQLDLHPSEWEETENWDDAAPREDLHVVRDLVGLVCLFAAFAIGMLIMGPMIDALFWKLL
jgi:hypothetical protein